jgi:putative alpha-1,2-mannosidase
MNLAHNYQNVWHPVTQFMSPMGIGLNTSIRNLAAGRQEETMPRKWTHGFIPSAYNTTRRVSFNSWVAAAPSTLGRTNFLSNSTAPRSFTSLASFRTPPVSWLYSHGNEPSFHIPYLYDFSGLPWNAQK